MKTNGSATPGSEPSFDPAGVDFFESQADHAPVLFVDVLPVETWMVAGCETSVKPVTPCRAEMCADQLGKSQPQLRSAGPLLGRLQALMDRLEWA